MKKGDVIIYDLVGMLEKIAKEVEKAKQAAEKNPATQPKPTQQR